MSQQTQSIKNISLYIPHVFTNVAKERIVDAFESKQIGKVNHVDLVLKMGKNGKQYNSVYVHFDYWIDSPAARELQETLAQNEATGKSTHFVYEGSWFWIVLENKAHKHTLGERKLCLALDSDLFDKHTGDYVVEETMETDTDSDEANLEEIDAAIDEIIDNEILEELIYRENDYIVEEMPDEEDDYLIRIDGRYVNQIEQENTAMQMEIAYLRTLVNAF